MGTSARVMRGSSRQHSFLHGFLHLCVVRDSSSTCAWSDVRSYLPWAFDAKLSLASLVCMAACRFRAAVRWTPQHSVHIVQLYDLSGRHSSIVTLTSDDIRRRPEHRSIVTRRLPFGRRM